MWAKKVITDKKYQNKKTINFCLIDVVLWFEDRAKNHVKKKPQRNEKKNKPFETLWLHVVRKGGNKTIGRCFSVGYGTNITARMMCGLSDKNDKPTKNLDWVF